MNEPKKLTPREYAAYRSKKTGTIVQPQNVYYYVRTGKLELETCDCGRKVLDVKLADEFFDLREKR
jgi:hypothetical protein